MTRLTFEEGVRALTKQHAGRQAGGKKKIEAKHEKLIEEVKARRAKAKQDKPSIEVRQHILESANRTNYMMEYDRLKGLMKSGTVGAQQSQNISKRHQELKELVTLSVGGKLAPKPRSKHSALSQRHEIYN